MFSKKLFLSICFIILESNALTCRSEGSLKSEELKKIYSTCLKQHENNSSSSNKISSRFDKRDRGSGQSYSGGDWSDSRDNMGQRNYKIGDTGRTDGRMDGKVDRPRMYDLDGNSQMGRENSMNRGRNQYSHRMDSYNENDNSYQNNRFNQGSYYQNDEHEGESQYQNMYSGPNRRYKRERKEKNSGQRSQYNPNKQRPSDDNHQVKNSSDNINENNKACAMHCFLDNLRMTGGNGMPDRYLVTKALTKDVKNEDLRDFLQESIEECFQIINNENTDDKCEFSKNLLICLSEKGRSNCDDWKDDIQFT